MEDAAVYTIVAFIGIIGTFFNIVTLIIVFRDRTIRKQVSYVPIISFLVGSAIQGATAFPLYVFRKLEKHVEHFPDGICDAYRVPYFYCGHIMKLSLFYVSLDRLLAIKFPFVYQSKMSTKRFALVIVVSWIATLLLDILPFFAPTDFVDDCIYRPNHEWGFTVIILFNIIPLITMIVCYSMIWCVALKYSMNDNEISHQQKQQQQHSINKLKNNKNAEEKDTDSNQKITTKNKNEFYTNPDGNLEQNNGNTEQKPSQGFIKHKNVDTAHEDNRRSGKTPYGTPILQRHEFKHVLEAAKSVGDKTSHGLKRLQHGMEMKATKTSLVLIVTYIVCWGPLGIFYMLDHFCDFCYSAKDNLTEFRTGVKILAFTSSFLTPLVYCWLNHEFRESATKFMKKLFRK